MAVTIADAAQLLARGIRANLDGVPAESIVRDIAKTLGVEVEVKAKVDPTWRLGDTIMVRFTERGREYLYVRGHVSWPAPRMPLSDRKVNELYHQGFVRKVKVVDAEATDEQFLAVVKQLREKFEEQQRVSGRVNLRAVAKAMVDSGVRAL